MMQLFNRLKKTEIVICLLSLMLFIIAMVIVAVPKNVLASPYGENNYGSGVYGQNNRNNNDSSETPTPTPTPTSINDKTNKPKDQQKSSTSIWWYIIPTLAILTILLFYFTRRRKRNS